jgi:uncharacterized protein
LNVETGEAPGRDERMWAMLCHLSAFAFFLLPPIGGVLGPLVVWMLKRENYPLVADQGREALNFQLTLLLSGVAAVALALLLVGFLLLLAIAVYGVVMVVVASIKASEGIPYRYPLSLRLVGQS